jgi:hypothetical protein
MKYIAILAASLWAMAALSISPASAAGRPAWYRVPAGTMVRVELAEPLSTKVQRTGDTFALRLATPLVVDGRIVLHAGTPGIGEVIQATKPGLGGKPAKLVLEAEYLSLGGGRRVRLQGLQVDAAGAGKSNATAANVVGLSGIAFGPLGFVGLAVPGGNVEFPAGMDATAQIAGDIRLPSLGLAPPDMASAPMVGAVQDNAGAIDVPPPPAGQGQVVFFRPKSLMGTGQWFRVRENGQPLGKLTNGAYFVTVVEPGRHTYTASEEPEFKDHLDLQIAPGVTYYVEGDLAKGLVLGAAVLSPSNQETFDKASSDLKPASTASDDDASSTPAAASAASSEAPPK